MNRQEVEALLTYIVGIDPRWRVMSGEEHDVRTNAWLTLLGEVSPEYATDYVRHHYTEGPDPRQVTPAAIRHGWRASQQREDVAATPRDALMDMTGLFRQRPGWFDQYRSTCDTAAAWQVTRQSAGDPYLRAANGARSAIACVPAPYEAHPVPDRNTPRVERERRCRNHDTCACSHTVCRDGWLDEETTVANARGDVMAAVKRCPFCEDAVKMLGERPRRSRR